MNNRWFWENKLMGWIENKLLIFTNWFWNKRHQLPPVPPKKEPQANTTNENKKSPAKKAPAKRTPAKKKTDWNVK
jgi:hypothetical protein